MPRYVGLLRAVNVGGTGKLPMSELRALCETCGFRAVQTYIASGNVVFEAEGEEADVQTALQDALHRHVGKAVGVLIRNADGLAAILAANPFHTRAPNLVHVVFLDEAPPDPLGGVAGLADEEIVAEGREIYIYYPQGQGQSKLKLPAARTGTARNINTVAKLAELISL
jgi:uncharacterized protein (DUF1697 family)